MRFPYLVFDLDGTLVDTSPALIRGLDEVLDGLGRRRLEASTVSRITGHGLRALLRSAVLMTGEPLTDGDLSAAVALFRAAYERDLLALALAAPGAQAALAALSARGARCAVLTNKPTQSSVRLLVHQGYIDVVDYVVGGDLELPRKPDAGGLLAILDNWQARREECLLVGSSRVDLQTARNAEVRCAMISPFGEPRSVFGLGADYLLPNFEALVPLATGRSETGERIGVIIGG